MNRTLLISYLTSLMANNKRQISSSFYLRIIVYYKIIIITIALLRSFRLQYDDNSYRSHETEVVHIILHVVLHDAPSQT